MKKLPFLEPLASKLLAVKKALLKFLVSWKVKQTKVTCCMLQRKREKNVNHLVAFGCLDFAWVCKQNQPMIRKARKVFFEIMSHNSKNLLLFEKLFLYSIFKLTQSSWKVPSSLLWYTTTYCNLKNWLLFN